MVETLVDGGWAYHDAESERLAQELEAAAAAPIAADQLVAFLQLASHTIGEHLGDWPRARRLCQQALAGHAPTPESAMAWARLSIACALAADPVGAAEAELTCLAARDGDLGPALIEARFWLVAALVGSQRAGEAQRLYAAALSLARRAGDAAPARAIAVASNNLASDLVEAPDRSLAEDALMQAAADAAHEFWGLCGTWVHEERALYLKALVANALGRPVEALTHADAALAIIAANDDQPVDAAFLRLARARALGLAGDAVGQARDLAIADAAAAGWDDAGLTSWFAEERAKAGR